MLSTSAVIVSELRTEAAASRPLALAAIGLCVVTVWLLQHPYLGITHDAMLYSLLALNRLHPGTLANDVFLRFGSQDSFTLFSPIYATAIHIFGLERAAALLTLVFQAGLLLATWLLARHFMAPLTATLAVAVLAVVPGEYGPSNLLHILDGFITARLAAEALVIGALAAGVSERYWIAASCIAAAMCLHPIMGCPGAVLLTLTFLAPSRPRLVAAAGTLAFVAALVTVLVLTPAGRLEGHWLYFVRITSTYLFLEHWSANDWSRVALPLAVLAIGVLNGTAALLRRLCAATLIMVACGLLASLVFGDLLHVVLALSAQTWRWLWLANVIAFTLSPAIATDCWRGGDSGRVTLMVLISAWIFRDFPPALLLVVLAIACAAVPERWTSHPRWRELFRAACVLLGLAMTLDIAHSLLDLPRIGPGLPGLAQQIRAACESGVIPGALTVAAWLLLRRSESPARVAATLGLSTLACGAALPVAWDEWTHTDYTPELVRQIAPWRAGMPAGAEVLWDHPVGSWYLLERPNYWSSFQMAGTIFSKEKSLLLEQRSTALAKAAESSGSADSVRGLGLPGGVTPLSLAGMKSACGDAALSYIVSWLPVAPTPYPAVTFAGRKASGKLYLYRCTDLRN